MTRAIKGLCYSESYKFVKIGGNIAGIGITDYTQQALGSIVYVDLSDVDDESEAGDDFGAVESVKAANDFSTSVSGTVARVNEVSEDTPELISQDAFGTWIIKIELSGTSELDNLTDAKKYEEFCNK